jgi:hypothetical protein
MTRRLQRQFLMIVCGAAGMALLGVTLGYGEPGEAGSPKAATTPTDATSSVEIAPRAKPRRRLPVYFARVVDDEQRQQIYAVQQSYAEQMEPLRRQLAELDEQMRAEVRDVLSDEQRQQVDQLVAAARVRREAAKAKRDAARAANSDSAAGE